MASDADWSDPQSVWGGKASSKSFRPYQPEIDDYKDVKIRIKLGTPITDETKTTIEYELGAYTQLNRDHATWKKFSVKGTDRLSPDKTQVWITLPKAEWSPVIPTAESHNPRSRAVTYDYPTAEEPANGRFKDSDTFESEIGNFFTWGVCARTADFNSIGNWRATPKSAGAAGTMNPWVTACTKDAVIWAGLDYLEARNVGAASGSRATVADQVKWFYYSSHGHSEDGTLESLDGRIKPSDVHWNKGLEIAIIAGCSVLDINDYNNNYTDPTKKTSPGKLWADVGPKFLLGYNYKAPKDDQGSDLIIADWIKFYSGGDTVEAWKKANDRSAGHNACAIWNGSTYYWFRRIAGVSGVGAIYTWDFHVKATTW